METEAEGEGREASARHQATLMMDKNQELASLWRVACICFSQQFLWCLRMISREIPCDHASSVQLDNALLFATSRRGCWPHKLEDQVMYDTVQSRALEFSLSSAFISRRFGAEGASLHKSKSPCSARELWFSGPLQCRPLDTPGLFFGLVPSLPSPMPVFLPPPVLLHTVRIVQATWYLFFRHNGRLCEPLGLRLPL